MLHNSLISKSQRRVYCSTKMITRTSFRMQGQWLRLHYQDQRHELHGPGQSHGLLLPAVSRILPRTVSSRTFKDVCMTQYISSFILHRSTSSIPCHIMLSKHFIQVFRTHHDNLTLVIWKLLEHIRTTARTTALSDDVSSVSSIILHSEEWLLMLQYWA